MPHTSAPSCELRAGHAEERRLEVTISSRLLRPLTELDDFTRQNLAVEGDPGLEVLQPRLHARGSTEGGRAGPRGGGRGQRRPRLEPVHLVWTQSVENFVHVCE